MSWQFLLLLFLFFATASHLSRRFLATRLGRHNRLINGFLFVGVLFPLGLVVGLCTSPNLLIGWHNLLFLLVGGAVFPLIKLLAFRASKTVDAGVYSMIGNIAPIITIVGASALLNQTLNTQQQLGAAIVLFSVFLVSVVKPRRHLGSSLGSLTLAVISAVLLGLALVFESWMLRRIEFGAYLVFGWGAQALWMAIIVWPERRHIKIIKNNKLRVPIFVYGVSSAFKGLCFVGALKLSGNAAIVSASSSFITVLVVLAAYVMLKEKDRLWYKFFVAVIGVVGLIVISYA